MMCDDNKLAVWQIHWAVLCFGFAGLFAKWILLPAGIIVLGRVFFAAMFLGSWALWRHHPVGLARGRDYLPLLCQGGILAFHWMTFFMAIQVSTVAVGVLSFSTFPVFATFLEPLVFKERLRPGAVLLALMTFGGVYLVVPAFEFADPVFQGVLWGTASGASFAVLSIFNRKSVQTHSSLTIALYQNAAATLVLLPLPLILPVIAGPKDILLLILLGVVFTGMAHSLFIAGLKHTSAHRAGIIACLEPVYGILAAMVLLGEIPGLRVITGGTIILLAVGYASLKRSER